MERMSSWARWSVLGAGIFAVTVSSTALSQSSMNSFSFGVSGGASIPTGDLSDAVKTGFNVGAQAGVKQPAWPIGLRLAGQWNRFKSDNEILDFNVDVTSVSLDIVLMPSGMTGLLKPYVVAGPSYFHTSDDSGTGLLSNRIGVSGIAKTLSVSSNVQSTGGSSNNWGFNAGGGVEYQLTGFSTFLEARYDWIHTDGGSSSFIPISVGIKFP